MSSGRNKSSGPSSAREAPVVGQDALRIWHFIVPVLLIAMAVVFLIGSWGIEDYGTERVPPQFFPRVLAILLGGCAGLCLLAALRKGRTAHDDPFGLFEGEGKAVKSALVLGATAIAIPFIGFYLSAFAGLAILLVIAGNRDPVVLIGAPVAILIFVFFVFDLLLAVPLPELKGIQ